MNLIEGRPGGGTDVIIASKFHVRQMSIPIIWSFVDDHSGYLSHGMIDALDAAVAVRMIGACRIFAHALQLVDSVRQLGAELEVIVGKETNGASPQMDVLVNQNFRRCLRS